MNITSAAIRLNRQRVVLAAESAITTDLSSAIVDEWREQLRLYWNYWGWMDGRVWEQTDQFATQQKGQAPPLLFPIQINPLYTAGLIHRNTLFGETPDAASSLVKPIVLPKYEVAETKTSKKKADDTAKFVSTLLETLLYQSSSRMTFLDAGFVSQAIGGVVLRASYEPWNTSLMSGLPVAIRQVEPEFFLPIYSMNDRLHLRRARIGRMIDGNEAKEIYGVDVGNASQALYMEDWVPGHVSITVAGKPASRVLPGGVVDLSGETGYPFVPFVYIPHEIVGQFYGVPIVHELVNLLKEYNGRIADVGDAVRNSIERLIVLTNVDSGEVKITNLGGGLKAISTGREMAGTQGRRVDMVGSVSLPTGTMEFVDFLQKSVWHAMATPPVAYGEDEGSQRSALTLAFRMWPLTSHIRQERSNWTEALRVIFDYAIRILRAKQAGDYGNLAEGTPWEVKDEHLGHMINVDWAPMIPRDRESEINQLILRHQDDQLPTRLALEKAGDIADVDAALEEIEAEREKKLALEQKYAAPTGPFGGGGGGSSDGGKKSVASPSPRTPTE